eukprot:3012709-Amphidinium_carterae.1
MAGKRIPCAHLYAQQVGACRASKLPGWSCEEVGRSSRAAPHQAHQYWRHQRLFRQRWNRSHALAIGLLSWG